MQKLLTALILPSLTSAPPRNAIVDLRFDTGGDNTQNRALMRSLAAKVPGRLFLLISPYTFSAGIASAAALIHDGGSKVTVIGEEVGDRNHWWSEHEPLCLPFSKACVDRETGYWDLLRGCAGAPHCYGDQFDLRVKSMSPQLRAPITAASWLAGRDPGLEAIRRELRRSSTKR